MGNNSFPWFRVYSEAASDPKFGIISRELQIDELLVFGAWLKIMCIGAESPIRGSLYVTLQKRYRSSDVAALLKIENDFCNLLLQSFQEMNMIDLDENGAFRITNWKKRQFDSDNSSDRVKKFRDKSKCNVTETLQTRYINVSVTPPDTDTDTDTELINMPVAGKVLAEKSMPVQQNNKKEIPKKEYGEFNNVRLTDEELEKLKNLFPDSWKDWIEKLSCWKKANNKKTASDYATIRNWTRREAAEKQPEKEEKREKWPLM